MNGPGHSARLQLAGLHPPLLRPVDLRVAAGETLALHGPSGAGKSLLLRAIADLDPNAGEAFLDGKPRSAFKGPEWRRAVMLVPAESHWWDDQVRPHAEHWDLATLAVLGFDADVLDWQTPRLSSGERQRLALVRALSLRPPVLLLDEATANLDDSNTRRVEQLLRDYQHDNSAAILWVSHDPAQRARIAHRRAYIGDGAVTEERS
jgi:ABC-type iron transport system FetAB ATPase subunit